MSKSVCINFISCKYKLISFLIYIGTAIPNLLFLWTLSWLVFNTFSGVTHGQSRTPLKLFLNFLYTWEIFILIIKIPSSTYPLLDFRSVTLKYGWSLPLNSIKNKMKAIVLLSSLILLFLFVLQFLYERTPSLSTFPYFSIHRVSGSSANEYISWISSASSYFLTE